MAKLRITSSFNGHVRDLTDLVTGPEDVPLTVLVDDVKSDPDGICAFGHIRFPLAGKDIRALMAGARIANDKAKCMAAIRNHMLEADLGYEVLDVHLQPGSDTWGRKPPEGMGEVSFMAWLQPSLEAN